MKKSILIIALLMAAFLVFPTGQQEPAKEAAKAKPVELGVVCSLTGPWSANDLRMRHGIQMAVEEINAAGGMKGQPLQIIQEDAESTSAGAVKAYNKLVSEHKLPAVITAPFSVQVLALQDYIKKEAVPTLSGATSKRLTEMGNEWLFRIRAHDGIVASLAAKYAVETLGAKRVGILHDTNEYGTGGALAIKETLTKMGLEPAAVEGYNTGDKDFAAQLLNLSRHGADIVVSWAHPLEGGLILRQIKQLNLDLKLTGGPGYAMPVCLDLAKEDAEGINVVIDFSPANPDPRVTEWVKKYQAKFGGEVPDYVSACNYDAVYMLANVMKEHGLDRVAIRDGLRNMKPYQGTMAEYDFDEIGNGVREVLIVEIEKGTPVVLQSVKQ
jgi:branched-chain amino acid transport system substrate-binding protein